MGRRRKAWFPAGTGRLRQHGKNLPGYYVLWNDYAPDGRLIRHSKNFLSRKPAREWLKRHNAREDLEANDSVIPTTYPDAIREFLAGCTTLSPDTKIQYTSSLSMFRVIVEDKPVHDIDGADVDRFIAWRMKQNSEATVAKHVRNLRRFFLWSMSRSLTNQNPLKLATSLPADNVVKEKPSVTDAQLDDLVDALDTQDRKLAVQLAMTTGLDRGVVTNLTAEQIDLEQRCIRIQRPKTRRRTPVTLVIPIHEDIVPLLADRIAQRPPGEPLLQGLARQNEKKDWWKRAAAKAGLPNLVFADLRSVAASRMQRVVSLVDTQHILGHSSPEITARHYTAVNPDVQQRLDTLRLPGAQT